MLGRVPLRSSPDTKVQIEIGTYWCTKNARPVNFRGCRAEGEVEPHYDEQSETNQNNLFVTYEMTYRKGKYKP